MYKAKLISADFEESTMEFDIEDKEFTAKKGDYVIMSKEEFENLSESANKVVLNKPIGVVKSINSSNGRLEVNNNPFTEEMGLDERNNKCIYTGTEWILYHSTAPEIQIKP